MENNKEKIEEAKVSALELYKNNNFICSEAILFTINRILGNPLPPEVVRLASGFAGGIGKSGNVCGALIGGVMALGLAFGRSEDSDSSPKLQPATRELIEWFEQNYGSSFCAVLTENNSIYFGKKANTCSTMTGETSAKSLELIQKYREMSAGRTLLQRILQAGRSSCK